MMELDSSSHWEHLAAKEAMAEEERFRRLPICEDCGERIDDDFYYDVDGDILCEECLKDRYRHYTEDYDGYDD